MASIAIIGSGNVAHHLCGAFIQANHTVVGVWSKTSTHSKKLADTYGIRSFETFDRIPESDFTIVSVSDNALKTVVQKLENRNGIIAHTSGTIGVEVFKQIALGGVFYPLQTFSKSKEVDLLKVPFLIEGNNNKAENGLLNLAKSISNQVKIVNSADRKNIHLAAVIACNFTNHLLTLAEEVLAEKDQDIRLLKPLVEETIQKAFELGPLQAQTGPAQRRDQNVLDAHLQKLSDHQRLLDIYKNITDSILSHS